MTTEHLLKIAQELKLTYIIKYLVGSSDEVIINYGETKTISLRTYLTNYEITSLKSYEVLITESFLSTSTVVFSFYNDTITAFRYGPWVDFIIHTYQTIAKEKEEFNENAWEPINL